MSSKPKSSEDWKYEITEMLGKVTPQADLESEWCKAVLKTLFNETEEGLDIRRYNATKNLLGKSGIRLTVPEAHALTDILLQNGYGSMDAIEAEYNRRRAQFLDD